MISSKPIKLPKHLSEIDSKRSLQALALSVVTVSLTSVLGYLLFQVFPSFSLWQVLVLGANSFLIGTCLVGFWIIAHECGHGSFLKSRWLSDVIGVVLHTICLIPFFAWARTHLLHHANHGHIEKDTAYVPVLDGSLRSHYLFKLPRQFLGRRLSTGIYTAVYLLLGWPLYLFWGVTGGKLLGLNHFIPMKRQGFDPYPGAVLKAKIWINTLIYVAWIGTLVWLSLTGYFQLVLWLYLLPIVWVNAWLVLYTLLHHTDEQSYWMDQKSWSFTEGALSAIDRKYWSVTNLLHHNIGRYHVYHHLNPRIPHYHGQEATAVVQSQLGNAYQFDDSSPFLALWRTLGRAGVVRADDSGRYHLMPLAKDEQELIVKPSPSSAAQ